MGDLWIYLVGVDHIHRGKCVLLEEAPSQLTSSRALIEQCIRKRSRPSVPNLCCFGPDQKLGEISIDHCGL